MYVYIDIYGERERETERERERQRQKQRQRHRHRETETERDRQRQITFVMVLFSSLFFSASQCTVKKKKQPKEQSIRNQVSVVLDSSTL